MRCQRLSTGTALAALGAAVLFFAAAPVARAADDWYVVLGDSYSRGSQPTTTIGSDGFAYQLPAIAARRGYGSLKVANFACGAATAASLVTRVGCDGRKTRVEGDQAYPDETQLAAATKFIRENRGRVALVTVSIGLNDLGPCVRAASLPDCSVTASSSVRTNVALAARELRHAAGPAVPIVGVGYPNVYLGAWVRPGGGVGHARAREMRDAFRGQLNPALRSAYREGDARFADVTKASGGYGSLGGARVQGRFGTVPAPVDRLCAISWSCDRADIHLNRSGYRLMARTVTAVLPRR